MLKAKKIAKVMLCICIAFSMFYSVNAEVIYSNGTIYQTTTTNAYGYASFTIIVNDNFEGINKYTINIPEISISNNELDYISLYWYSNKAQNINIYINDNNNITVTDDTIYNVSFNNYKLEFYYNGNFPGNGFIPNPSIYYYVKNKTETTYTLINIPSNIIIVDNLVVDNIENAINNINNVFISIINLLSNIINFITDKPWIIILGVTVSLLSFLIYKAKSII